MLQRPDFSQRLQEGNFTNQVRRVRGKSADVMVTAKNRRLCEKDPRTPGLITVWYADDLNDGEFSRGERQEEFPGR